LSAGTASWKATFTELAFTLDTPIILCGLGIVLSVLCAPPTGKATPGASTPDTVPISVNVFAVIALPDTVTLIETISPC